MGKEQFNEEIVSSPDFSDNEGKAEASLYNIEKIHDNDSEGLVASWKLAIYRLSPYTTLFSVLSSVSFYAFRIFCVVQAQRKYQKPYIVAWVFVFTEACLLCESFPYRIKSFNSNTSQIPNCCNNSSKFSPSAPAAVRNFAWLETTSQQLTSS